MDRPPPPNRAQRAALARLAAHQRCDDFDADLAELERVRHARRHTHHDRSFLLGFIDKLWAAYMSELGRSHVETGERQ